MTLEKLGSSFPNFGWDRFFKDLGKPDPGQINVAQPAYCKMFDDEFEGENLDSWKGYLKCQLLLTAAPLLSKPFSDAVFDITSAVTGATQQPPRWRKVIAIENAVLANAMGRLYVNRVFSPEAKQSATKLVENLKAVLRERIQQLDWMGPDTKKEALAKLDAMTMKVGYPEVWRDYGKLEIKDDSFVQNVFRANEFEFLRNIERLDRPVDERAFEIPPQAADAFYVPTLNAVVLPAGILQPPFFDAKAPDAQNYGAIGCIIGHEMTHGFDNNGRQFDSKGELRDWWSIEDSRRFLDKASELIKQYDRYVAVDDIHVDGDLTLPENIADNGGMTIAYLAYKKATAGTTQPTVDDFTPDQQFFLAFAQVWRQKVRPEIARIQARNDVHAPPRFRVIGVLANHPEFWQAFGAEPPSKPITIW
jgi:putative endopeptidase